MHAHPLLAVMNAAIDAVVLIDHCGDIQAFNRAAERMFGWPAQEICGRNVSLLMPEPHRSAHDAHMIRYLASGVSGVIGQGRELQAQRRDGTRFPVYLSLGRVEGADPAQFVGFIRDTTEERRALARLHRERELARQGEEQARLSTARLMHVSRMATIGEMAAGVAHELNQPLAAIANYAYASERLLGLPIPDVEEVRGAVREIAAEAMRAGAIIRRLRALARGAEGEREHLRADELMEDLRQLTQAEARSHGIGLHFEPEGSPVLHVHRVQIIQVLLNLVRNALDALLTDEAGEHLIVVRCRRVPGDACEIAVMDNGPGVAPDIIDRMFDPFQSTRHDHAGLGLPMSRTMAQAHGGDIRHEPLAPRGACFVLTLPATARVS